MSKRPLATSNWRYSFNNVVFKHYCPKIDFKMNKRPLAKSNWRYSFNKLVFKHYWPKIVFEMNKRPLATSNWRYSFNKLTISFIERLLALTAFIWPEMEKSNQVNIECVLGTFLVAQSFPKSKMNSVNLLVCKNIDRLIAQSKENALFRSIWRMCKWLSVNVDRKRFAQSEIRSIRVPR